RTRAGIKRRTAACGGDAGRYGTDEFRGEVPALETVISALIPRIAKRTVTARTALDGHLAPPGLISRRGFPQLFNVDQASRPSLVKIAHFQQTCAGRREHDAAVGTFCPSVVQNHIQQRAVDAQTAVVFDEAELAEFVHE